MWAALVFCASAAFVAYVLFGYPLLVWMLARRRPRSFLMRPERRTVSILLPVHNGAPWIRKKLESILALDYPRELIETLVISDGSEDGTDEIVRDFEGRGVRLLRMEHAGKAAALTAAMAECQGEILFFTDVRQELASDSLRTLVSCFADPEVGVASGELVIRDGETQEEADVGLYWRYEKWIRSQHSRIDSVLGATGCIYAMRRELAVPIPPGTLLDDIYLPLAAFFKGYRIVLVNARAFDHPASLKQEFRRKVRTLAGAYALIAAYPALLGPANRMWIHFVSHRFARLLLPYALLAIAVSSLWLPPYGAAAAVCAQIVFYGLAALDPAVAEGSRLKPVTSPLRTFVVLMAACLCAISILFRPSDVFWREEKSKAAGTAA